MEKQKIYINETDDYTDGVSLEDAYVTEEDIGDSLEHPRIQKDDTCDDSQD